MLFILIMTDWGSNPRALNKALGALCNPRWPAAHGRSSPTTGTTSSQALYRLRRLFYAPHQKSSRAHSAAPPFRIKPACGWALIRFYVLKIDCPHQTSSAPHLGTLLVYYNLQFELSRRNSHSSVTVSAKPTGTERATRRRLHPCRGLPSPDTARLSQAPIHP